MSFIKKPFEKIKSFGSDRSRSQSRKSTDLAHMNGNGNGTSSPANGESPNATSRNTEEIERARHRRSEDKLRRKSQSKQRPDSVVRKDEKFLETAPEEMIKLYKPFSMNQSKRWDGQERFSLKDVDINSMSPFKVHFYKFNTDIIQQL